MFISEAILWVLMLCNLWDAIMCIGLGTVQWSIGLAGQGKECEALISDRGLTFVFSWLSRHNMRTHHTSMPWQIVCTETWSSTERTSVSSSGRRRFLPGRSRAWKTVLEWGTSVKGPWLYNSRWWQRLGHARRNKQAGCFILIYLKTPSAESFELLWGCHQSPWCLRH